MNARWKMLWTAVAVLPAACCEPVLARTELFATDGGSIFRLRDLNGDGDALDPLENILWSNQALAPTRLTPLGGGLLASDVGASGELVWLRDVNGDGDALDVGEALPWFVDPLVSTFTDISSSGSAVYAAGGGSGGGKVYRLLDLNGDGDARDPGEFSLFAEQLAPAGLDVQGDRLIVGDSLTGEVHAVRDINGDGDALDVGERLVHSSPGFSMDSGIQFGPAGSYYVTDPGAETINRIADRNGDGDALDVAEVLLYADPVPQGVLLYGPMAIDNTGSLFVGGVQGAFSGIYKVSDLNGDGDALDVTEVRAFAETPMLLDIVAASGLPGDFDFDGDVDGVDFLIWQRGGSPSPLSSSDLADWQGHFGVSPLADVGVAVPEPASAALLLLVGACVLRRNRSRTPF